MTPQQQQLIILGVGVIVLFLVLSSRSQTPPQQAAITRYVNEERWEIQRDARGYIQNITVHRDAHSS